MTDTHLTPAVAARYLADGLRPAEAASVETHVLACGTCQASVAHAAAEVALPGASVDTLWRSIQASVNLPPPSLFERILRTFGVPDHVRRVVAATQGLAWSWVVATVTLAVVAALAEGSDPSDVARYVFLVLAPLAPLSGVAAVYAPAADPLRELVRATPVGTQGVLLLRTVAVGSGSMLLLVLLGAVLPVAGSGRWLLPAIALSAGSIALAAWMPVTWAAGGLGGLWVAAATGSAWRWQPSSSEAPILDRFVALRPGGQLVMAVAAAAALALILATRDRNDLERGRMLP